MLRLTFQLAYQRQALIVVEWSKANGLLQSHSAGGEGTSFVEHNGVYFGNLFFDQRFFSVLYRSFRKLFVLYVFIYLLLYGFLFC